MPQKSFGESQHRLTVSKLKGPLVNFLSITGGLKSRQIRKIIFAQNVVKFYKEPYTCRQFGKLTKVWFKIKRNYNL